jgi:hypothetical protein
MFFNYIRQGIYVAGEYRVYRAMCAGCCKSDRGPVFDPGTAICTGIGSTGE